MHVHPTALSGSWYFSGWGDGEEEDEGAGCHGVVAQVDFESNN
jgi:hypothetical protein